MEALRLWLAKLERAVRVVVVVYKVMRDLFVIGALLYGASCYSSQQQSVSELWRWMLVVNQLAQDLGN